MTDFVSTWNNDSFLTYPVGPLGLIAMPGTEAIGEKVNAWLKKWRDHTEESLEGDDDARRRAGRFPDQGQLPPLRKRRRKRSDQGEHPRL